MRLVPLHNNLVVDPISEGEISRGGLLLPKVAQASRPYRYATVMETGPGRITAEGKLVPCSVKVGDTVAYAKNQGTEFPLETDAEDKVVLLINEQFILGIVTGLRQQSRITGLDGRLLEMAPNSRAPSDVQDEHVDLLALARKKGIIEKGPDGLDEYERADLAERD